MIGWTDLSWGRGKAGGKGAFQLVSGASPDINWLCAWLEYRIAGTFGFSEIGCTSPRIERGARKGDFPPKVMTAHDLSGGGREMSQQVPS